MDSKAEAEFIQEGIKECIDEGLVLKNQKLNRGSMVVAAGESMGVYIYGRYEENRFVYEYHFPFLMGSVGTQNDEITIERHLDKESFAAVCDEAKTGVTLIFYLQNIMDYLDYLVKTAGNQNLPALLDTRGASVKNPVPGKRAVMTALSIGGMILLPIRKKQEKDSVFRRLGFKAASLSQCVDALLENQASRQKRRSRVSYRIQVLENFLSRHKPRCNPVRGRGFRRGP